MTFASSLQGEPLTTMQLREEIAVTLGDNNEEVFDLMVSVYNRGLQSGATQITKRFQQSQCSSQTR